MDAAIHEVNQLLGEVGVQPTTPSAAMATVYKSILSVDRRYKKAYIVRAEAEEVGQGHRGHSLSITWAYGLYRDASSPPCPCVLVNLIGQPLLGRHLVEE